MSASAEIGVLGGGIIGTSIAVSIAKLGRPVTLLESLPELGAGATRAAIGGITPVSDDYCRSELRLLSKWSAEHYAAWISSIESNAGIEIPFLDSGLLYVGLTDTEWTFLRDRFSPELEQLGVGFSVIEGASARLVEPSLTTNVLGLVHIPLECAVEPAVLMLALSRILKSSSGVKVKTDSKVESIVEESSGVGVITDRGEYLFERIIVSLGLATRQLFPMLKHLFIGVRGQALELRVPGTVTYPLRHHIYAHFPSSDNLHVSAYLVPRVDGRIVAGVTYEPNSESPMNTAAGVERILNAAFSLIPAAIDWEFCRAWSGIRPGTIDRRPIIGFWGTSRRVLIASGHFGLGVTLAPLTSQITLELLGLSKPELTLDFDTEYLGITESRLEQARSASGSR